MKGEGKSFFARFEFSLREENGEVWKKKEENGNQLIKEKYCEIEDFFGGGNR